MDCLESLWTIKPLTHLHHSAAAGQFPSAGHLTTSIQALVTTSTSLKMVQIASILTLAAIPLLVAASPVAQPAPPKAPASAPAQKPAGKAPTTNAAPSGAKGGAPAKGGEVSGKALPPVKGPVHPNAQAILSSLRTMKKGQFTPHLGGGGGKGKTAAPSKGSNNKSAAKAPAPKHLKGLPQGTHMLAYDHVKGQIHAYGKGMKLIGSIAAPKGAKAPAGASKGGSPAPKQNPTNAPARMTKQKRDGGCTALSSDDVQKRELLLNIILCRR